MLCDRVYILYDIRFYQEQKTYKEFSMSPLDSFCFLDCLSVKFQKVLNEK